MLENDETHDTKNKPSTTDLIKDEDVAVEIGSKDDPQRIKMMSKCRKAFQRGKIGPK